MLARQTKVWLLVWLAGSQLALADQTISTPRTLEELNRWYAEPASGSNAATHYMLGFAALNVKADSQVLAVTSIQPSGPVPHSTHRAISNLLWRNRAALSHFRAGARYSQCRYPIDFADGTLGDESKIPYLTKIIRATDIMALNALWLSYLGRGAEAADAVVLNLRLAQSLQAEPDIGSQFRRCHITEKCIKSLEQVINRVSVPETSLERLQAILGAMEERDSSGISLQRALIGKRVVMNDIYVNASEETFQHFIAPVARLPQPDLKDYPRSAEGRFIDDTVNELIRVWSQSYPRRYRDVGAICNKQLPVAVHQSFALAKWLLEESFPRSVKQEAQSVGSLRLARIALALEFYRARHGGNYPQSLAELRPAHLVEIPADPFDGKPIRYRKRGTGYVLYSIGPNLKDDGGARGQGESGDLVFEMARPL